MVAEMDVAFLIRDRRCAEAGHAASQHRLGELYSAKSDYKQAVRWFTLAAEAGFASAQCELAELFMLGRGAVLWLSRAAAAGVAKAQNHYGRMLQEGRGVAADPRLAAEFFEKAAAQGDTDGMVNLGAACLVGRGVPQDEARARELVSRAADAGDDDARRLLNAMDGRRRSDDDPKAMAEPAPTPKLTAAAKRRRARKAARDRRGGASVEQSTVEDSVVEEAAAPVVEEPVVEEAAAPVVEEAVVEEAAAPVVEEPAVDVPTAPSRDVDGPRSTAPPLDGRERATEAVAAPAPAVDEPAWRRRWGAGLKAGDGVDARDSEGRWFDSVVVDVDGSRVKVHFAAGERAGTRGSTGTTRASGRTAGVGARWSGAGARDLDAAALAALRRLPGDEAAGILRELATMGDRVRNRSAYVSCLANAAPLPRAPAPAVSPALPDAADSAPRAAHAGAPAARGERAEARPPTPAAPPPAASELDARGPSGGGRRPREAEAEAPRDDGFGDATVAEILERLDLRRLLPLFRSHEIDDDSLFHLERRLRRDRACRRRLVRDGEADVAEDERVAAVDGRPPEPPRKSMIAGFLDACRRSGVAPDDERALVGGVVRLPGSKSLSNRALLIAALCEGETTVENLLASDDTERMLEAPGRWASPSRIWAARRSGVRVTSSGALKAPGADLFLGNAGTAMRPLAAVLAAVAATDGGDFPLVIEITDELISQPYVQLTVDLMAKFGVVVDIDGARAGRRVRFAEVLRDMGAPVTLHPTNITVAAATPNLKGIDVDCLDIPDAR
ncbi:NADP+ dependent shikimate 3-dehydrogenase [Aureococcus anophagefferens]|uniref:NADP+ dependent shikimate 3-dehydrogenase n=1 Tax=Aureococcus anophagefferens TaxID=44056 RepID=A0ABR1FV29_AURAN